MRYYKQLFKAAGTDMISSGRPATLVWRRGQWGAGDQALSVESKCSIAECCSPAIAVLGPACWHQSTWDKWENQVISFQSTQLLPRWSGNIIQTVTEVYGFIRMIFGTFSWNYQLQVFLWYFLSTYLTFFLHMLYILDWPTGAKKIAEALFLLENKPKTLTLLFSWGDKRRSH